MDFEILAKIEMHVLSILRRIVGLSSELSSLQIEVRDEKTILLCDDKKDSWAHAFRFDWDHKEIVYARVAQVALVSGWLPEGLPERKTDGYHRVCFTLSRHDPASAACLSEAALKSLQSESRPRLPDPRPSVELGTPLCGGCGWPPEETPR